MRSTLALVLPEEISEECEAIILDKIKSKMRSACSMVVRIVRAFQDRYGDEAAEIARQALLEYIPRNVSEQGAPEDDLRKYVDGLEKGCSASHEWERVMDEPDQVEYRFTRCMWAEVFRELDAADIGGWICEGDDPAVNSFHPKLRCRLTKTLMKDDPHCNHAFYVEHNE